MPRRGRHLEENRNGLPLTTQNPDLPASIDEREFSTSRKGYDKREVRTFLGELETNFRELEEWATEAKLRLQQAEFEAQKVKEAEGQSVDAAIAAVLESKDRILERARKHATEIENEAQARADAILDGVGVAEADIPPAAGRRDTLGCR
jgi:DivIVA domain-containing protein